jgi:hypothetical protein
MYAAGMKVAGLWIFQRYSLSPLRDDDSLVEVMTETVSTCEM